MNRNVRALVLLGLLWGSAQTRAQIANPDPCSVFRCDEGGIIRGRTDRKEMALIFTGGDFADGGELIRRVLREKGVRAGFFFTGDFYRSPANAGLIRGLISDGHYLGPHSDKHLLYCPWEDRAKTIVPREEFRADLLANYRLMETFGLSRAAAPFFIPPYEWYNREIAGWARELGLVLFNFTPGTSSNADYTTPDMPEYQSSRAIWDRIWAYEGGDADGLNGFILLIHIGTDPRRTDKFYFSLGRLIDELAAKGYRIVRIDRLLAPAISSPGIRPGF
ncbi:MAG: polysaccharide deacetylase family protein [Candidatus Aminicenantales bacterium]